MKKILYSFAFLSLLFTSCNPLEDIYKELDAEETVISGTASITLTDEDYETLDLSFGNFSSLDDAKEMLPAFLSNKYPVWGKESLASVTFKLFFPKRDERSLIVYEATDQDYTDAGLSFPNISNNDQMIQLLNSLYPNPENRVLISLTYTERDSGINTEVEDGFIYNNGTWEKSMGITLEEYKSMGEPRAQFTSEDEALVKIPVFLDNKLAFEAPEAGDIEGVMYKLFVDDVDDVDGDGRTDDRTVYSYVAFFIYDGSNWSKYNNVINETIQFGHDGTTWVPDNTIAYTLTQADYDLVGNGNFANFDVREGRDEETIEARLAKINTILLNNFPEFGEGQKFAVSYNVWKPGDDVFVMNVIHDGTKYRLQTDDD